MTATFMPKPFTDRTGSGLHLHLSLWRAGEPLFPEPGDPRGLGLSKTAYSFLAGVLEHACGLSAVIAPTVNSYKRLLVTSGDGFAIVRDAIACKPAIIAETDAWVAMASEFRALAELPGIDSARIWEPEPERVYAWAR